jgi:pyruvate/2-oxoglutarate dehydrogenase complex dihydrolipoamide acyltransferase (E2) component
LPYCVTATCTIAADQSRHIAAPFDGIVAEAHAVEGDRVRKGQLLCKLDTRDLEYKRDELAAEINVLEREMDRAMGAESPVEFQLARAKQQLARAKLKTIEARIDRATLRSAIDGVVIAGDLRRRVDGVVAKGEPLYEVAPSTGRMLEIRVPERAADEVRAGLSGYFAPWARPERTRPFHVTRIRPAATIVDAKNVYIAEGEADLPDAWLLPGMEGTAKIEAGRKPVWRIVFQRVIDFVRMHLWL